MTAMLFAVVGALAGGSQAVLLARTARRSAHPLWFLARLLLVAAVLVLAALFGALIFAAAGWGLGFVLAASVVYWRLG